MKPNFTAMLHRVSVNEDNLRKILDSLDSPRPGFSPELVKLYNETVDAALALRFYLNEDDDSDGEDEESGGSLLDVLNGEASEVGYEAAMEKNRYAPRVVIPKNRMDEYL